MRRRKGAGISEMEAGQDSFLDIVSNIVGVLIILVMIAGARTRELPARTNTNSGDNFAPQLQQSFEIFAEKSQTFRSAQAEVANIGLEIEHFHGLTAARTQERTELTALLGILQAEYDLATEHLSHSEKQSLELKRRIQEIDAKLAELDRTRQWIEQNRPQATVLENLPTPHSKTVEKNEAHFRIKGGKILHVPLMALFERVGPEVRNRLNANIKPGELTGTVGPIDNFTMPYRVIIQAIPPGGIRADFAGSELIPQNDQLGETIQEALAPNSEFQRRLMGYRQDIYTITFWVYPDSFNTYQVMKKHLFGRGYQTAARPLNWNDPIAASPEGTKSQAQ